MARTRSRPKKKPSPGPADGTRLEYLEASLVQVEKQARAAEKDRSWVAATRAKAEAIKIRAAMDEIREVERRRAAPETVADHKAEVLSEIRRLRIGATEAGSYVAAAQLLRLERDILTTTRAEQSAAEAEAIAKKTVAELAAEIDELQAKRAVH